MPRIKVIAWLFLFVVSHLHAADATQAADELALKLRSGLAGKTLNTIAFLELEGPEKTQFGTYMTDKLINAFQRETRVSIFTRLQIESLIKEYHLNLTGIIDPKTTIKFGEMTQVDALATGKYIVFGESVEIAVQVFDVRTAQQIASAETSVSKTKDIINLLSSVAALPKDGAPEVSTDMSNSRFVSDIHFSADKVKREGGNVTFTVELVNKGVKRKFHARCLYTHITIDGKTYVPKNIVLLGQKNSYVFVEIPSDVRIKMVLEFENVPEAGKIISILDMRFELDREWKNLELRNIPIE